MRKISMAVLAIICCASHMLLAQGRFSATVINTSDGLIFKLRPGTTTKTGFSTIEFFLRYPDNSPAFTYGPVSVNTTNFPGMTSLGSARSGSWEIERNNPAYLLPGYKVDHFIYTAPAPISVIRSYKGGTEYELVSIPVVGAYGSEIKFQLIHQDAESNCYLAITGELGNDLRPTALKNYFYPLTSTMEGPAASTYYFMNKSIVLPIKLASFDVKENGCNVNINWSSSGEIKAAYYIVERSSNNMDFTEIGQVGAGSVSSILKPYSFVDNKALNGNSFYRLRFSDADGKLGFSSTKEVNLNCSGKNNVIVYPTLSDGTVNVKLPAGFEKARVRIINSAGEEVALNQSGGLTRTISLGKFANGAYMVQVINENKVTDSVKVILQQ